MVMGSWEFLGGGFELLKKKVNDYVPLCSNNFRNSSNLTFYRIPRDENNFSFGVCWIKLVICDWQVFSKKNEC